MSATWEIIDNALTHEDLPSPLPSIMQPPYPPFWWYIDNGRLTTNTLPDLAQRGAFAHCKSLNVAHIPESCKQLGEYTFRNTALESVKIANDCTYSTTTFPEDCEIEFYEDGESNE